MDKSREKQMAEPVRNSKKDGKSAASKVVSDFVNGLSEEHRMLIILKAQLYGGTWEPMLDDLRNRLAGKPYIFKLANRIQDDIERIEQMQKFEAEQKIDLADYIDLP
ncbi:MAG: hypothetical protein WAK60_11145 [Sedimentisphaerales bacterium]